MHSVPLNDIAVLVTASKLTFSAKVQPICLTTQPIETYHDTEVVVAGWGYFELGKQMLCSSILFVIIMELCNTIM